MGKYLAYTSPARGHLYPIVDTLIELRRRGHEVAVRTIAAEVPRMERLGFSATAIAPEIEAIEPDDYLARTPVGANTRILKTFARRGEHEIGDLQRAIAEFEPDALLIDVNCQGAATVAEAEQRPWAMWTPYFMPLASRDAPPFGLGLHPRQRPRRADARCTAHEDRRGPTFATGCPRGQPAACAPWARAVPPRKRAMGRGAAAPLLHCRAVRVPALGLARLLLHARPWHLAAAGRAAGLARADPATACARDALDRVSGRRQACGGRAQSTRERGCRGRRHDRGGRSGRVRPAVECPRGALRAPRPADRSRGVRCLSRGDGHNAAHAWRRGTGMRGAVRSRPARGRGPRDRMPCRHPLGSAASAS